jgi:hypothetical protein
MVIDKIYEMIGTDDDISERNSYRLVGLYERLDERGKGIVNATLIFVCGFSLPTLVKMVEDPEYDHGDRTEPFPYTVE